MLEIRERPMADTTVECCICKAMEGFQVMYEVDGFRECAGWVTICKTCLEDTRLVSHIDQPMDTATYQEAAQRTECDQIRSEQRMSGSYNVGVVGTKALAPQTLIRLNHGAIGIVKEGGEILSILEKTVYYGRDIDPDKVKDELGDVMWYVAEVCNALSLSLQDVLDSNIRKLKARYPDRYTDERAANRDRAAEDAAMKDVFSKMKGDPVADSMSRKAAEVTEEQILRGSRVDADGVLIKQSTTTSSTISHPSHEWGAGIGGTKQCVLCGKFEKCPDRYEFKPCSRELEGKTEYCCECGESYPHQDLLRGYIYCSKCRGLDKAFQEYSKQGLQPSTISNPSAVDSARRKRTRADVLRARNTMIGCCSRYADHQSCDCLETALAGSDVPSTTSPPSIGCKHCQGNGWVTDEWSSDRTACPICNGSGIMDKSKVD